MINLKIKDKGYFVEIPGVSPFRTPAEVNISHVSIPLVVSTLKTLGINSYEIVSDTKGKESILTQRDFVVDNKSSKKRKEKETDYEKRFNKLEELMSKLLTKQVSDTPINKEQITNRLDSIENLIKNAKFKSVSDTKEKVKEPKIMELQDTFIPDIDLSGMEIKGEASQKTVKQDKSDIDDTADLLSRIMQSDE